jgi:hypothetical protein
MNCLGLQVALQTLAASLATNATLFPASKWRRLIRDKTSVYAYCTNIDLAGNT